MSLAWRKSLFLFALIAVCIFSGCTAKKTPSVQLDFPAMHIEADPQGKLPPKYWDAYTLFNKGNKAFDAGQYDAARELYTKVLTNYPEEEMTAKSLFNIGLCHEREGDYEKAIATYGALQSKYPGSVDMVRLMFRYAYCYETLSMWAEATVYLDSIQNASKATPLQKLQAQARRAIATYLSGKKDQAKKELRAAMEKYEDFRRRNITIDNYYYAKTCFYLGEYYYSRYETLELSGDVDRMAMQLENIATLFMLSRAQYLKSIRTYDDYYTFASLHKIGQGYEQFAEIILNAPVPEDLSPDQKAEYINALKEKVEPAIKKAVMIYQRNVKLGVDLGASNEWLENSKKRLQYLESGDRSVK